MKTKIILFFYISIFLISCGVKEKIDGKYRSNFAELGFFITEIELKSDSTFHYKFSGDLLHTELDGKYIIKQKKLYLRFDRLKNETQSEIVKINEKDTLINFEDFGKTHSYELKKENEIEYHLKYKISNHRLYVYNVLTDKIVRKANGYSINRKFYLFGTKYYRKKRYLNKIEK